MDTPEDLAYHQSNLSPSSYQGQMEDAEPKAVNVATDPVDIAVCTNCNGEIDVSGCDPFDTIECPACGAEQTVPARLGSFLLLNLISTGGMGGVFYARDESLGRYVAIKVMLRSLGESAEFVANFRREAQVAASLNHPNVAQIYSFGQEKGQPYIVMELVSGRHFDRMVAEGRPLDPAMVMQVAIDVADGLKAASERGLVHGDIKPENILLDEKGAAKIVDFGLASFAHQATDGGIWGTPYYIAPERVRRQKVDERADIYSLGATLFHALAGRPPFEGETPVEVVRARLDRPAPSLGDFVPQANARVQSIIARMLEEEPARRYPTYASLLGDLHKALKELAPGGPGLSGKRLRVRRKTSAAGSAAEAQAAETGTVEEPAAGGRRLVIRKSAGGLHGALRAETAARKEERGGGCRRAFIVLLVIAAIAGAAAGGVALKLRRDGILERRRAGIALQKMRDDADAACGEIRAAATNLAQLAGEAAQLEMTITNAAAAVLGEGFDVAGLLPPETATNAVPAATNAAAAAATNAAANAPEAAAGSDDAPRNGADESGEEAGEPEIVPLARQALALTAGIVRGSLRGREIETAAGEARQDVHEAARPSDAREGANRLDALRAEIAGLESGARAAMADARAKAQAASGIAEARRKRLEDEARAREEEERRRREEEERLRLEEETRAQTEADLAAAEAARQSSMPLAAAHDFQKALAQLRSALSACKTDTGKQALSVVIQRYERMQKMKAYFITAMAAKPIAWGYGQGPGAQDILGADERGVQLKDRRVPWSEVAPAQMLRFADHFIAQRETRIRDQAEIALAAAIYAYEVGGERGIVKAREYVADAIRFRPDVREEAARLLPLEE
ncbi:MAG: hypothetical protein FJ225_10810 [Lentisphaerae bacterium]|nr:hypothetical protein [Lentisphaerota bacterium]